MENIFISNRINWTDSVYASGGHTSRGILCPYCRSISAHTWYYGLGCNNVKSGTTSNGQPILLPEFAIIRATCNSCGKDSIWKKERKSQKETLVIPKSTGSIDSPNPDMPDKIAKIYNEAALVLNDSPRASAALARLAIDELTAQLDTEGSNLNDRIGKLVEKGLPIEIQQSLDIVRVIGNNAVHPGKIDVSDNTEMATALLELLNIIVDNRISQPKKIAEMYANLPAGALKAISKRDSN